MGGLTAGSKQADLHYNKTAFSSLHPLFFFFSARWTLLLFAVVYITYSSSAYTKRKINGRSRNSLKRNVGSPPDLRIFSFVGTLTEYVTVFVYVHYIYLYFLFLFFFIRGRICILHFFIQKTYSSP